MNIAKPLTVLALTGILSGCFLTVDVNKGGKVESSLGECAEFISCTYEVTDTSFDESFTAIPNSGYTFSHWRGGDKYQCPGSENPVCQVSNTGLAGNANAEAVIAGNSEYKIEPVFTRNSEPKYVVRDGDGNPIGDVLSVTDYGVNIRYIHTDSEGVEHGIAMSANGKTISVSGSSTAFWSNPSCSGDPTHTWYNWAGSLMEPLFTNKYVFLSHKPYGYGGTGDMAIRGSDDQAELATLYKLDDQGAGLMCVLTFEALFIPVTIEVRDFLSQFKPPFSLQQE